MRARLLLALLFLVASVTSFAIDRPLPDDAKLGKLSMSYKAPLVINGKKYRLAAGAQIRDQHNRIVLPQSISVSEVAALYQVDNAAQIYRLWLLTKDEAARYVQPAPLVPPPPAVIPDRRAKPSTGARL